MAQPTLQELIAQRKGGRSFSKLSEDAGNVPSASRFHQLSTEVGDFPNRETIEGIAQALRLPVRAIVVATMASFGWDTGPQHAELMDRLGAYDLTGLDSDEVEAIISVVAAMTKRR